MGSKSPFLEFFTRGLNLSLSTDDPLMFHQTKEPLMEEYSLAKQFFRLSSADLCELARNSVLQSGFPPEVKAKWLGSADPKVNDKTRSNVPNSRLRFRRNCHQEEMRLVLAESHVDAMTAFRAGIPFLPEAERNDDPDSPKYARERSASRGTPRMHPMGEVPLPYVEPENADGIDNWEMTTAALAADEGHAESGPPSKVRKTD